MDQEPKHDMEHQHKAPHAGHTHHAKKSGPDSLEKEATKLLDKIMKFVQKNPIATIVIVVVVILILAVIF